MSSGPVALFVFRLANFLSMANGDSVMLLTQGTILGCVPLGGSGSGFVIQDHLDQGVPKERDFGSYDQLP